MCHSQSFLGLVMRTRVYRTPVTDTCTTVRSFQSLPLRQLPTPLTTSCDVSTIPGTFPHTLIALPLFRGVSRTIITSVKQEDNKAHEKRQGQEKQELRGKDRMETGGKREGVGVPVPPPRRLQSKA